MKLRRTATTSVFGALGLAVAPAGLAWAWTGQTLMQVGSSVTGPAGSPVQVSASTPTAGSAQLRWGGGQDPIMARGMLEPGKTTSLSGTVPARARPGVYYLVLVSDGNGVAQAANEVTGGAVGANSVSAWSPSGDYGTDAALTSPSSPSSSSAPAWSC